MFSLDHRTFLEQDFAIVDPSMVDMALLEHLSVSPLGQEQFRCNVAQLPHLVTLRDADERIRLALLDTSDACTVTEDAPPFCALLRTNESAPSLRQRLSQRLLLTRARPSQSFFFRYFDPRVFLHLMRILDAGQMRALLSPGLAWVWFNPWAQRWCEHGLTDTIASSPAAVRPTLRLSDAQLDAVARIELLNRVLLRLKAREVALGPQHLEVIDAQAVRAITVEHLSDADDQLQFILNAAVYGAHVHDDVTVRRVLERVRNQQISYVNGMNALGNDALEALRLAQPALAR